LFAGASVLVRDPAEAAAFDPDPAKGLPPHEIAWY